MKKITNVISAEFEKEITECLKKMRRLTVDAENLEDEIIKVKYILGKFLYTCIPNKMLTRDKRLENIMLEYMKTLGIECL